MRRHHRRETVRPSMPNTKDQAARSDRAANRAQRTRMRSVVPVCGYGLSRDDPRALYRLLAASLRSDCPTLVDLPVISTLDCSRCGAPWPCASATAELTVLSRPRRVVLLACVLRLALRAAPATRIAEWYRRFLLEPL